MLQAPEKIRSSSSQNQVCLSLVPSLEVGCSCLELWVHLIAPKSWRRRPTGSGSRGRRLPEPLLESLDEVAFAAADDPVSLGRQSSPLALDAAGVFGSDFTGRLQSAPVG